jgi:hypothetical protein
MANIGHAKKTNTGGLNAINVMSMPNQLRRGGFRPFSSDGFAAAWGKLRDAQPFLIKIFT